MMKYYTVSKENMKKMPKEINHKIKPYIIIFLFLLVCLILLLLSSCNPAKQLQRKEDKAYGITVSTPRTFSQAGALWLAIHPCVSTVIKTDTGKIIIKEVPVTLPPVKIPFPVYKWKKFSFDTLINGLSVYIDSNGVVISGEYICKERIIPIKETQRDDTKVNNLTDSLNATKISSATKDGIIQEKSSQLSEQKKTSNRLKWYLGGSFFLLILSHVARSYFGDWVSSAKNIFKK